MKFDTKRFVEVALVVVELVKEIFVKTDSPVEVETIFPATRFPIVVEDI